MGRAGVQDKTTMKRVSPKRRDPVKVVYIGDPKMFQASASDFRALVQSLTGRNEASMPLRPEPLDLPYLDDSPKAHVEAQDPATVPPDHLATPEMQTSPDHDHFFMEYSDFSFESFNEWILQRMLDAASPGLESSSDLYGLGSETCSP
ncbi:uncharacterized protein LOC116267826 [Nymphaea colorata]|uniref:uncharacterized protein LOC116267826 n=1 Tax=Nymphaea colorata TaxID=210225 RepID=UPI00129D85B9|nr:uncharacterized protein LOC116267826 [Nymphaea colorata]